MKDQAFRRVGFLARPHGIRGEFVLHLETDFPEWLAERPRLFAELNGEMVSWRVTSSRLRQAKLILAVDAIQTRNDAEDARGTPLFVTEDEAGSVAGDPDYFFNSDLVGLTMYDARDGAEYGRVSSVFEKPAQNLLEVKRPRGGAFLFPFVKALIAEIDLEGRRIGVFMPEGLVECNDEPAKKRAGQQA